MAKRASGSQRWPVFTDFDYVIDAAKDAAAVPIEGFDSPEAQPIKKLCFRAKENRQVARISRPRQPQHPLVFRRLDDQDTIKISQSESSQPDSVGDQGVNEVYISQSEPPESANGRISDSVEISQSDPEDSSEFIVPKLESGRHRPVPRSRSEPVVQAKAKFPKNGLANRLASLRRQQESDVSVWHHRSKYGTQIGRSGSGFVLKKQLQSNTACVISECEQTSREDGSACSSKIFVIFKASTWRDYEMDEGKRFMIFAPYLRLVTDKFSAPVIVGPMFLQVSE